MMKINVLIVVLACIASSFGCSSVGGDRNVDRDIATRNHKVDTIVDRDTFYLREDEVKLPMKKSYADTIIVFDTIFVTDTIIHYAVEWDTLYCIEHGFIL